MRLGRTKFAILLLLLSVTSTVPQLTARKDKDKDKDLPVSDDPKRALHALNRLTFGPRPGDVQQVIAMGVEHWIDLQLHPERIDDSALNARLEPLLTLHMSTRELAQEFPDPQEINQVMNGKRSMPSDPARRAIYEVQLARLQNRKDRDRKDKEGKDKDGKDNDRKDRDREVDSGGSTVNSPGSEKAVSVGDSRNSATGEPAGSAMNALSSGNEVTASANAGNDSAGGTVMTAPVKLTPEEEEQSRAREEQLYADLEVQQLPSVPPDERFKKILGMSVAGQVAFADSLRGGKGQEFLEGMVPKQKETLLAMNNPGGVVTSELAQGKLLRAIYSQRQFEEVMTDFWINHFNVFVDKGLDRLMLTSYERDVIRPHALGKFEDLLVATAKSPAMLFYLDNWLSVGPESMQALGIPARPMGPYGPYGRPRRFPPKQNAKRKSGLNENYGRELLELHTLSVNGGYSQRDVTEVAKVFTGWTIDKPYEGATFRYDPRMHEPGPKFVLGHRIDR